MGNNVDVEQKRETEILQHPKKGEASPLYWACRNGDIDTVRKIIESTDYAQLNKLEPNGSTALHAAAHYGHVEIVRILLHEKNVMRHHLNRYDLTAYEEASTDEIRELFDRPRDSQRFCSDTADNDKFVMESWETESYSEEGSADGEIRNDWLTAAASRNKMHQAKAGANLSKTIGRSPLLRTICSVAARLLNEDSTMEVEERFDENVAVGKIERIIDANLSPVDPAYDEACSLVSSYKRTGNIIHLLRLYTLETPFYKVLSRMNQNCFLMPVFSKLNHLQNRSFQGKSYRGVTMTRDDLQPYHWLHKQEKGVLVFQKVCSSSTLEDEALKFARQKLKESDKKLKVIMVFNFPQKCDTAIQLFHVSAQVPAVTKYPQENEVLLLPCTLFRVKDIKYNRTEELYHIYLENFTSNAGIYTALKSFYRESMAESTQGQNK